MAKSQEAYINPKILTWARETSGYSLQAAARKLRVDEKRLNGWETGETKPSVAKLRSIAHTYKYPTAVFYMPHEPERPKLPEDFRRLDIQAEHPLSAASLVQIRKARERQNIAVEISSQTGIDFQKLDVSTTVRNNPENLAAKIRALFGERIVNQSKWVGLYDGLKHWRYILESYGFLVSFARRIDSKEFSAFSIYHDKFPAIVINSKDYPKRRLFSLMHELCHVMLHHEGICENFGETSIEVEKYCNHFAGAVLVPEEKLLQEPGVAKANRNTEWGNDALSQIALHYGVSREVILRRLLMFGKTNREYYMKWRKENAQREIKEYEDMFGDEFIEKYVNRVLRTNGENFTSIIMTGLWSEKITTSDALGCLDISVQHLKKLEDTVLSRSKMRME